MQSAVKTTTEPEPIVRVSLEDLLRYGFRQVEDWLDWRENVRKGCVGGETEKTEGVPHAGPGEAGV